VEFDRVLYGDAHPYGRPGIGTAASLAAFTVEDLKTFYQRWYRPNNAALIVVGDMTASTILPKLEAMFAAWPSAAVPEPRWPKAEPSERREVYLVDKPSAAQSEIRVGRIGVSRDTEDYYALVVMNTILGGSFTSRLNQNLREEHGYSYGARSFFDFEILPGPFTAGAAVQTAVTDSALAETMKELRRIREPVSDEEMERARNFVALRFPERFQTVARIAAQLADLELYSLPDDYFNTYVDRILGVTRDEVQRVAREYIDPDHMAIVIVGDREVIERGVRGLDLGAVHVLSVEDVLGKPPVIDQAE
jgi:predicted Zn-dependent peptidase